MMQVITPEEGRVIREQKASISRREGLTESGAEISEPENQRMTPRADKTVK